MEMQKNISMVCGGWSVKFEPLTYASVHIIAVFPTNNGNNTSSDSIPSLHSTSLASVQLITVVTHILTLFLRSTLSFVALTVAIHVLTVFLRFTFNLEEP